MMDAAALLAIVRTELRLLVRRPGYWLYVFLLAALAVAVLFDMPGRVWQESLVGVVTNIAFYQFPLVALVAAPSVVRHKRQAGEWLWSSGVESPMLVLGQVLGLVLGLAGGLLAPLTLGGAIVAWQGSLAPLALAAFVGYGLVLLVPITILELGLVFSLSLWLRQTVPVVLLAAGVDALLWLGVLLPIATLFTPLNHTLLGLHPDPVAGLGAERAALFPLLGLYLALPLGTLALSTWGLALVDRRSGWRPEHGWRVWATGALAVAGSLVALVCYRAAVGRGTVPPPVVDQAGAWTVVAAQHSGAVAGARIEMDARLALRNASEVEQSSVVLALNPGLQVSQAAVDGRPAEVRREGEAVRLSWPGGAIGPGEPAQVDLSYAGPLRLLREDYALVSSALGRDPTAFRRPVGAYLDTQVTLLQRDGDWRVWPLVAGPHLATEETGLELAVPASQPIASSGALLSQGRAGVTYRWSGALPQLLLASAPYRVEREPGGGLLLVAPQAGRRDAARARSALDVRRALAGWLEGEGAAGPYQVALLPYARETALGGAVIGLPGVPERDGVDASGQETVRHLAASLSQAWLLERLAWPAGALNTEGQLRAYVIESKRDETGQLQTVTRSLGGVNPQAPHGRLVEAREPTPLFTALSTVLGQGAMLRANGDAAALADERRLWATLAAAAAASNEERWQQVETLSKAERALSSQGLLSRDPGDAYQLASLVVEIDHLRGNLGDEAFARLVRELAARHPLGGAPLTEDAFWQIAGEYAAR